MALRRPDPVHEGNDGSVGMVILPKRRDIFRAELYLPFEGVDEAQTATDRSVHNHSVTLAGNAQIDTAQAYRGASSLLLDGTGDQVDIAAGPWNFGTADFTIQMAVRWSGLDAASYLVLCSADASNQFSLVKNNAENNRYLYFSSTVGGEVVALYKTANNIFGNINQWYLVTLQRVGAAMKLYIDKGLVTFTETTAVGTSSVGGDSHAMVLGGLLPGHMDEVVILKGKATLQL